MGPQHRTTECFPGPHSPATLRESLVWSWKFCSCYKYTSNFWAHPSLRTRGLRDRAQRGEKTMNSRKQRPAASPAPASKEPRWAPKSMPDISHRGHSPRPGFLKQRRRGGLSCFWVCRRFACVCLEQSLYLTGTSETDFINRCEHEWFLWLACFQSSCLTGVCVQLSKYFYGDSIHNTMAII